MLLIIISIILVVLKLFSVISLGWFLCFLPAIIAAVFYVLGLIISAVFNIGILSFFVNLIKNE